VQTVFTAIQQPYLARVKLEKLSVAKKSFIITIVSGFSESQY
jgi:hypothetical protein